MSELRLLVSTPYVNAIVTNWLCGRIKAFLASLTGKQMPPKTQTKVIFNQINLSFSS